MAFVDKTKSNIAYKMILGKGHTNNDREAFNEGIPTKMLVLAQNIWSQEIPYTPPSGGNTVVSDKLTLNLEPISGTDNTGTYSAYRIKLGAVVPASIIGKKNRLTGTTFQPYDYVGQIVPLEMGPGYQPFPYEGDTAIYPMDASDWFIDNYAGILTQETDNPSKMRDYTSANSKIECFIYVGKVITESFGGIGGGSTYNFYDKQTPRVLDAPGGNEITPANGIGGDQDGQNRVFTLSSNCDYGSEHVYFNGMLLQATKDYTLTGNTLTFSNNVETSPGSGDYINRTPTPSDLLQVSYREKA